MHLALRLGIASVCIAASLSPALAFELKPISRVFAPSGRESTQSFEVTNASRERIALEVSAWTLHRDDNYVETNQPSDDDFLIYPSQLILPAGQRQTIRVTWLGDPNPSRELLYRIVVEQLPIQLQPGEAGAQLTKPVGGVRVLMTYRGTMFIRPPSAAARVSLHSAVPAQSPAGAKALAITLVNTGSAHAVIDRCSLKVSSAAPGASVELRGADLKTLASTRVLAGSRRRYLLPWPSRLPAGVALLANGGCDLRP